MGKYSDKLLSNTTTGQDQTSWSDRLLEPELFQERRETGPVSTITNKRKTEFVPDPTEGASWNAIQKSGWVDKPKSKIQIFAAERFPDLTKAEREAKYKIIDGEIAFLGSDGKYHKEIRTGDIVNSVKSLSANMVSDTPAMTLSMVGALGGPLAAGLGAAGGEGIRKTVGTTVFGENQSTTGNMLDMAGAFALAFAGEKGGELIGSGANALRNRAALGKDKTLKYVAGNKITQGGFTAEEHAKAEVVQKLADSYGIDLAPHQLYDKKGMENIWKYLRQHPQTSNAVQAFERTQGDQVEAAMNAFTKSVGREADLAVTGSSVVGESKKILEKAIQKRTDAISPLYTKALSDTPTVPEITVRALGDELQSIKKGTVKGGAAHKAVDRVETMLKSAGNDSSKLQMVKQEIDAMIADESTNWTTAIEKGTKARLTKLNNGINDVLENSVPGYKKANQLYQEMTAPIDRIQESVVGRLGRMQTDKQKAMAVNEIFNANMSPELISKARTYYRNSNPDLWDDVVSSHIANTFNKLKETESGELVNVAGKIHKNLFGSKIQRERMRAAMGPELYKNFEGLMTVYEGVAKGSGKESMTMPFSRIDETLGAIPGSKIYRYAMFPRQAAVETVFSRWNDLIVRGRQSDLFEALTSKTATEKISKLKLLKPGTETFLKEFGLFSAWLSKSVADVGLHKEIPLSPAHQQKAQQGEIAQ